MKLTILLRGGINLEENIYDAAVVGCGPAGISAAINLEIRNKSFVFIGGHECSPKLSKAERIDNYPGFFNINGKELKNKLLHHIEKMDIPIINKKVNNIYRRDDYYSLLVGQETYNVFSLILAIGVSNENYLPGEEELVGRGVSYCATCDGPLYRNKKVAVIAGTHEAVEEAEFLSELAETVYFIPLSDICDISGSNIEIIEQKPEKIIGDSMVEKIVLEKDSIPVQGVFIIRKVTPPDKLLAGLEIEDGHINVNRSMETVLPGVYAAGDCTGTPYQIARAVGEGQTAALNLVSWLREKKKT